MSAVPDGYNYLGVAMPALARALPRVALGAFPTPVSDSDGVTIKHDEYSHEQYGGNKLRKLEYLLGQALRRGATHVATFGAAGSNHALATAIHTRRLGMQPIAFLCHQHPSPLIGRSLEIHRRIGTDVVYWGGDPANRRRIVRETLRSRRGRHWVIPMGGSSWVGAMGYVAAAFELRAQIDAGQCPEPDRIYVPLGTMGTVAGLAVGLRAARLSSEVCAVRVVDPAIASAARLAAFTAKLLELAARLDDRLDLDDRSLNVRLIEDQFGAGYGVATPEAKCAVDVAARDFGLRLETTYSGKAFAALLEEGGHRSRPGSVLFWNTYNGPPRRPPASGCERRALPEEFGRYVAD